MINVRSEKLTDIVEKGIVKALNPDQNGKVTEDVNFQLLIPKGKRTSILKKLNVQ